MSLITLWCLFGLICNQASAELGTEAIIGGHYTTGSEAKYTVAVFHTNNRCGGAIIHDFYILTAAHCVTDQHGHIVNQQYTVVAGTHNLRELHHAIIVHVSTVFIPKKYIRGGHRDIAVLKLAQSLQINHHHKIIAKVNLPKGHSLYENVCAIASGYGYQDVKVRRLPDGRWEEYDGKTDDKLKWISARVISNAHCRQTNNREVFPNELCAQVEQPHKHHYQGICDGDSGGPLVYGDEIIGVIYLSPFACNETRMASLYTRVSSFVNMIRHILDHGNAGHDAIFLNLPH